ncbi:hypothetical protein ABEW34_13075 [Paenibacillus algorifonticola]|uniref:hypothetical protein n=1 Tax=Paenibacillus algorifonticola TaxID=684063 RepID=UPI003D273600
MEDKGGWNDGEKHFGCMVRICHSIRGQEKSGWRRLGVPKDDPRLEALWDIPKVLTEEESDALEEQDEQFWEDEDKLSEKAYAHYYLLLQLKP